VTARKRRLRDAPEWIHSRYDSAKVSNVVFIVFRDLEVEIAWRNATGGRACLDATSSVLKSAT
jgi:hypothetical protein